jgi:hypothetical protein
VCLSVSTLIRSWSFCIRLIHIIIRDVYIVLYTWDVYLISMLKCNQRKENERKNTHRDGEREKKKETRRATGLPCNYVIIHIKKKNNKKKIQSFLSVSPLIFVVDMYPRFFFLLYTHKKRYNGRRRVAAQSSLVFVEILTNVKDERVVRFHTAATRL